MISFSDESNVTIFFCFYLIIFIVTVNFYRMLKSKGKAEELHAFPCVPVLVWFHFIALFLVLVNLVLLGVFRFFTDTTTHPMLFSPIVLCLFYHDTMTDWMVPLILIYSIMLSHDIQEEFHLRCFRINRDTLIWIAMIFYGCLFNSFNPWDNITIRRIHHVNGHISTSFNVIDALLMAISVLLVSLHGYRMSLANALRDNRFHITLLFILIKTVFLFTSACLFPAIPDHDINLSDSPSETLDYHVYSLDNLKMYESVVLSAVPVHYLTWKHLFFRNIV